jgi:RES domain-containing protein
MENLDYLFNLPDDQFVSSLKLKALTNILKHESRFALREPYRSFVDLIIAKIHREFNSIVPAGTVLYRGRLNALDFHNSEKEVAPFPAGEMGPPPHHLATPGRVNPEGIHYLYCAGELDTAGSELRPWKGARITIAEIKIVKDVPIVDLTMDSQDADWQFFYDDFARTFSLQWPPDLKLNYLPTQFFSEHLKAVGLRGISYKSEFNTGGKNFALFYADNYEIINTYNVETIDVSFCFYRKKNYQAYDLLEKI